MMVGKRKQVKGKRKYSHRMRRNAVMLSALHMCPPNMRRAMIQKAPPDLIDAICECVLNILKGNVKLSSVRKKNLGTHKHFLRHI